MSLQVSPRRHQGSHVLPRGVISATALAYAARQAHAKAQAEAHDTPAKERGTAVALECVLDDSPAVYFGERYHCTGRYPNTRLGVMFRVMVGIEERVLPERLFKPCNPRNWHLFSPGHQLRWNKDLGRVRTPETAA